MAQKKDLRDFSLDDLKRLGREAGKEAREASLDAGIEIMSEDDEGNLIYEKKNESGEIVTRPVPAEELKKG